ncbi:MAG TPA: extracellular solute-binding protein [Alphaproteobacteria bacterium]|jgi:multiple sugar transport system substrate-binding protein|nr:extracellular solute-binding protein [Alphaproteobacteria bacterium]
MNQPTPAAVNSEPSTVNSSQITDHGSPVVSSPKAVDRKKIFVWVGIGVLVLIIILVVIKLLTPGLESQSSNITWWGLWEDTNVVQPLISSYETSHPNVKITYIKQSPQDYRERLTSALAKSSGPDIFTFHNTWVPMFKNDLDTLPASIMNPADFAKTFYPIMSSDLTSGNGIVGIPLGYDALALYINEDIFNKAGKTAPTTWDDLRKVALELTVKDDQGVITQSGIALGRTENVDHWQEILALMMLQNGVDLTNPTGKPAEDALTFFTAFANQDGVWDATLPSSTQAFAAGKLAMYIGPSWRAFEIFDQNPNLKFSTRPIPQLPKDNPKQLDITYATYWASGVWSKSSRKSAAWEFLKFLSTQDSLQKLYQSESKVRDFGEPYPQVGMANLLKEHPIVGSIVAQAPGAESWYLASRTFDGPTGINSQIANYFGDAVNAVADGKSTATQALETAAAGVTQVLKQYRLVK